MTIFPIVGDRPSRIRIANMKAGQQSHVTLHPIFERSNILASPLVVCAPMTLILYDLVTLSFLFSKMFMGKIVSAKKDFYAFNKQLIEFFIALIRTKWGNHNATT